MNKIFFAAAFPPPVGGQSNINKAIADRLSNENVVVRLDLSANSLNRGVKYHLSRLIGVLKGLLVLGTHHDLGDKFYISVDSGLGLVYNIMMVGLARALQLKIFLHYHSFTFVDKKKFLVSILVAWAGNASTHIFLCECMLDRFKTKYKVKGCSVICSNLGIIFEEREFVPKEIRNGLFSIGLISHLSNEKGLIDFIDLLRAAKIRGTKIFGILAGPPVRAADLLLIQQAVVELDGLLRYEGAVYGSEKSSFFQSLNCFVFPTRFKVEAQPLVLFEAIGYGLPIISFDRGCIGSDMKEDFSLIIPRDRPFVDAALDQIEMWIGNRQKYDAAESAAKKYYKSRYRIAAEQYKQLVTLLTN